MQRKKRLRLASSNRSHIKNRMIGHRQTIQRQHPKNADKAATRIVNSNVTGMKAGQLFSGRPPTLIG